RRRACRSGRGVRHDWAATGGARVQRVQLVPVCVRADWERQDVHD
ncbi:Unc104-like kinesin, putative, partial [Trypanosoma cruzi marinkellei]